MKAIRKMEVLVHAAEDFKIGDQIEIGKYTATCQKVTKKGALFLLDQYLDTPHSMNMENTNKGGYAESDLRKELQKEETLDIFGSIRDRMAPFKNGDLLRIPYAEELFGKNEYCRPSGKKQWELMKNRQNRISDRAGEDYEWGWLQNESEYYNNNFTRVSPRGTITSGGASLFYGVRPVFRLV